MRIADGRILTGEQAKQIGLVDQLGNLQDTVDIVAKMVGIEGKPNILYPKKRFSVWELLVKETTSAILDTLNDKGFGLDYRLSSPGGGGHECLLTTLQSVSYLPDLSFPFGIPK